MSDFMNDASVWLAVSAGGSIVVGVLFLQLFRNHAGVMTRITIGMQVSSPEVRVLGYLWAPSLYCSIVQCGGRYPHPYRDAGHNSSLGFGVQGIRCASSFCCFSGATRES